MELREVKRHMNRTVQYSGSVLICGLEQIESEGKP